MTRIIHASDVFYPSVGGLERSVSALVRRQQSDGHEVIVVTPAIEGYPAEEHHNDVEIHRFPQLVSRLPVHQSTLRPYCPPFADPILSRALRRFFVQWQPDVVHAHGLIAYSATQAAHDVNAAVVSGVHDYSFVCVKKTLLRGESICPGPRLSRCLPCAIDHFGAKGAVGVLSLFAFSGAMRDTDARIAVSGAVARLGSSPRQSRNGGVQVVPTFIDDEEIERASRAEAPGWIPGGRYLFYAGALTQAKGIRVLLEAFAKVRESAPDVSLVMAALTSPSDDVSVEGDGVMVVRDAPHPEILGAWRAATMGVHPAVWGEPCSLAVLECLAAGTPIVATDVGGNPDLLDNGRAGVLVPARDVDALADAISELLGDDERRTALGRAGQARARVYGLSQVLPQLEGIYGRAIDSVRGVSSAT